MAFYGLPSLPKISSKAILNTALGSAQSALWSLLRGSATWGIYESGKQGTLAFEVDTIMTMTLNEESTVSDYRIQTGSFVSFNKVAMPMEVPISFVKSGTDTELSEFVSLLKTSVSSTTKYDILMPEKSFTSMTMTRYSIERKRENSINMLFVDCWFKEVREAPEYYYSKLTGKASTLNADLGDATPTVGIRGVQPIASYATSGISNTFSGLRKTISNSVSGLVTSVSDTASSIATSLYDLTTETWDSVSDYISGTVNNSAPKASAGTLVTNDSKTIKA